jgi:hypothetical protein
VQYPVKGNDNHAGVLPLVVVPFFVSAQVACKSMNPLYQQYILLQVDDATINWFC